MGLSVHDYLLIKEGDLCAIGVDLIFCAGLSGGLQIHRQHAMNDYSVVWSRGNRL